MYAVMYGDADTVRLLLNYGADPDAANAMGATALIWAVGDPAKAQMLIEYGANVNAKSALGRTALLVAASTSGAGGVVDRLVEKGADVSAKDGLKGNPKLMTGGGGAPAIVEAAKSRDGEALRSLLRDPHVDVNAKDANGGTALTEAVINGHYGERPVAVGGGSFGECVGVDGGVSSADAGGDARRRSDDRVASGGRCSGERRRWSGNHSTGCGRRTRRRPMPRLRWISCCGRARTPRRRISAGKRR